MTNVGSQLLAQTTTDNVIIDSIAISNYKPDKDLSQVDESFFDIKIPINAKTTNGNTLQVESALDNTIFNADYQVYTVGVTAHAKDSDNSILLAIAQLDNPIVIPANLGIKYTQYFDFSITNDKATNITAEISPAGTVSNNVFSNAINSLTSADSINASSFSNELSNYATNSSVNSQLASYVGNDQLSSYATLNSINTALSSYATNTSASSAINSLSASTDSNNSSINSALGSYATTSLVNSQLSDYATNNSLASYATNVAFSSAINSLSSSDNLKFNMLSGLMGNYAMTTLVNSQFSDYATTSNVASQIASNASYANNVANNAYQNAVNTAKGNAVQDNHDGTITVNGNNLPLAKQINSNADLFAITTPGTYISRWGFQDTLKNFPSPDGSATIIYTGMGLSNGLKIDVLDSWGNEYVTWFANGKWANWQQIASNGIKQ